MQIGWKKPVKLPKMSQFKSNKLDVTPYDKFYEWLILKAFFTPTEKLLFKKKELLDKFRERNYSVRNIYLCSSDNKKLEKELKNWAYETNKFLRKKYIKTSIEFYKLEMGPAVFLKKPKWAKPGFVYIKETDKNE